MSLASAGVIAVIRLRQPFPVSAARALVAGGITAVELTLTTPQALESLGELTRALPDCLIGAGSVLDGEQARAALRAGARFCVSPTYNATVQRLCEGGRVPYLPGAFTPTEILRAHQAGADLVKLFPAQAVTPMSLRP